MVIAHILGVIASSVAHRENLARAMISGYKRGEASAQSPAVAGGIGILLAVAVIGFWVWSIAIGGLTVGSTDRYSTSQSTDDHDEERDQD